jgi:hypothetical protein
VEKNGVISSSRIVFSDGKNLDEKIAEIKKEFTQIVNDLKEIESKFNLQ